MAFILCLVSEASGRSTQYIFENFIDFSRRIIAACVDSRLSNNAHGIQKYFSFGGETVLSGSAATAMLPLSLK
jgi:hypothetical protein